MINVLNKEPNIEVVFQPDGKPLSHFPLKLTYYSFFQYQCICSNLPHNSAAKGYTDYSFEKNIDSIRFVIDSSKPE